LGYPVFVISGALVGYVAGTLTTASFLPQVWHSFRSRSCRDLSYAMLIVMGTGTALWALYGVRLQRWPIILPNAVTLCLIAALILMKASYHAVVKEGRG
jgi:MtN3 and saliva related transmembrane protein